jgi:putative flippase GtrA
VVPVYNEEVALESSVLRLRTYLDTRFPFPATVTIADNASTDRTWAIASDLARRVPGVRAIHLSEKGRGRALRAAWSASPATVVAYMDVDLATDLDALLPLVAPLVSGHSDVAIGSRLARGAHVVRGPKRELISRAYNLIVRSALHNGFSDAQCGFKALRGDVAHTLVPQVSDDAWFFDTELLVRAERSGLRIHEVPVDWVDDPDSRVDIVRTALDDLRGIWRLMTERPSARPPASTPPISTPSGPAGVAEAHSAELTRSVGIGVLSTGAYLVVFLLLSGVTGPYLANTLALVVCTAANTVAHSRFTFTDREPLRWRTGLVGGLTVLATSLALTTAALAVVGLVFPHSTVAELVALIAATAVAALVRFVVLRAWMFRAHLQHGSRAGRVEDRPGFPALAPAPADRSDPAGPGSTAEPVA